MKKYVFILYIVVFSNTIVHAQEHAQYENLLMHADTDFSSLAFQFLNGKQLTFKDLNTVLTIPENELLLKQIKTVTTGNTVSRWITLGSAISIIVFLLADDLPGADFAIPASCGLGLAASVAASYTGQAAGVKYLRAVDNYNLRVMGIQSINAQGPGMLD